ncbi:MAG: cysteine synthase A [Firmicutes bacterium HGW-Firmicutes-16]|nr:MAG: cysteine synthase A [Firmicutes bacterium HGW-Firmicutes-16]
MEKIYHNITELIGNTPLVELGVFGKKHCPDVRFLAKLERNNPAGSAKDRVALSIIRAAEGEGKLKKGGMIIEATSGNTGVGLAAVASVLGYETVIVLPDNMSVERIKLIKAYGAKIVLTEGAKGMSGALDKAEELHHKNEGSIIAGQFENPANPEAHYKTTGPEIWRDTDGKVDAFVAGVGSGGTITGVGRYLKEKNSLIRIIAVEPDSSALLSGESAGAHRIQGIGANFIPEVLDRLVYDEVARVTDDEAFDAMRELAETEGLFVGISSGAATIAAAKIAARSEYKGKTVVVLLPDTGERYLSML